MELQHDLLVWRNTREGLLDEAYRLGALIYSNALTRSLDTLSKRSTHLFQELVSPLADFCQKPAVMPLTVWPFFYRRRLLGTFTGFPYDLSGGLDARPQKSNSYTPARHMAMAFPKLTSECVASKHGIYSPRVNICFLLQHSSDEFSVANVEVSAHMM